MCRPSIKLGEAWILAGRHSPSLNCKKQFLARVISYFDIIEIVDTIRYSFKVFRLTYEFASAVKAACFRFVLKQSNSESVLFYLKARNDIICILGL